MLDKMRRAGRLVADTLDYLETKIQVGISTNALDDFAGEYIIKHGGIPATVGYFGFKHSICTSINDEICHGIPSLAVVLKEGDILKVDLVVKLDGVHADSARTYIVGEMTTPSHVDLLYTTQQALYAGIRAVKHGSYVGDIGSAILRHSNTTAFQPIEKYGGHTIGQEIHMKPLIPNTNVAGYGEQLEEGMFICIEPMLTMGKPWVYTLDDGWTVSTIDGCRTAHFEHTVAVLQNGYEILTLSKRERDIIK